MPAAVQHRSTSSTGVTSLPLAFLSGNAAGNLLVYASGSNSPVTAATDNNVNIIANATSVTNSSGGAGCQRIDYVANSNAGANTITAHVSPSDDLHIHIWEISGCVTTSPVRSTGTVTTSTTASVSTSTTTPLSGDAVVAFFFDNPAADTLTAGSGYSPSELTTGAGGDSGFTEYKTATAGGTQTATCSGNTTHALSQAIAVFIQSSASQTVGEMVASTQYGQIQPFPLRTQIIDY